MVDEVRIYNSEVNDLFSAQEFVWWLSDLPIGNPLRVVFSSNGSQLMRYFDSSRTRDIWVAGFEAILEARISPIEEER